MRCTRSVSTKHHGEHGFAVVDAGQPVYLSVERGGLAQHFQLARAAMFAQHCFADGAAENEGSAERGTRSSMTPSPDGRSTPA